MNRDTNTTADNAKMQAALELAQQGYKVFPLVPGGKEPLLRGSWREHACNNPAQIKAWWDANPDANIGMVTDDFIVIDVDPRNGGTASIEMLAIAMDMVGKPTRTHITASGGMHLLYRPPPGVRVGCGTNKLGPGLDVKAVGGYIVAPGSTINGKAYTVKNPHQGFLEAPAWLVAECGKAPERGAGAGKRLVEENPEAIELAQKWLDNHAPHAVKGQRNGTAFVVAARFYDFGVSKETCRELLSEWSYAWCSPPMDADEIETVSRSAAVNRQKPIGCDNPENTAGFNAVDPGPSPQELAANTGQTPKGEAQLLATPVEPFDPTALPPRPWVVPGYVCRARITLLAGPGGVAKSTYTLMLAVAVATGRSDICGFPVPKRERVWVWNQEDDQDEMHRRLAAVMAAFNVAWEDLRDEDGQAMLYLNSGVDKPLVLAKRNMEHIVGGKDVADAVHTVRELGVGVAMFDPLIEFHEAMENDNVQMRAVMGQLRKIAVEGDCAVVLATHTRKPPQASSDGFAGEMDAARGASSQLGVVRIGSTIFSMSPKESKKWEIDGAPSDYVRIDIAKNNLAPPRPEPIWFKRESVPIGVGGESVGVLRPVELAQRVVAAKTGLMETIAKTLKDMPAGWHTVSAIKTNMAVGDRDKMPNSKNQARVFETAFFGAEHLLTNSGTLKIVTVSGKETVFQLQPPQ